MDIQLEKIELMKKLLETDDVSILNSIKNIFQKGKKDWWEELSEEQQNTLNESIAQYERGEYVSFDEFIKPHL